MRTTGPLAATCLALLAGPGLAQPRPESPLPPPDRTPALVVNHAGPHAPIQSVVFGPDGTLYAGGFGKLVHRYTRKGGAFVPADPIRVPVGPGNAGAVNAVAVAPDGKWVAVAGRAPFRGEVWAGMDDALVVETRYFAPFLKRDYGVVYLVDPADPRGGRVIRGAESEVRAVAFANPAPAAGPVLVTAGVEWDAAGNYAGTVRVFDVTTGKELAARKDLPPTPTRPGLAAWASGPGGKGLRVAVAWPKADNSPGDLLVWDVTANRDRTFADGQANVPLAARVGKDGAVRDLISGGFVGAAGRLAVRPVDPPAEGRAVPLAGTPGQFLFPLAVAPVGDATAVLVQVHPPPAGAAGRPAELRVLDPGGTAKVTVPLAGLSNTDTFPSLAASPDGRFVAVGGFADARIEVYDAAALLAGRVVVDRLPGAPDGFSRVGFVGEHRLWLGGPAHPGGLVVDFEARTAAPAGGGGPVAPPAVRFDPKSHTGTVAAGGRLVPFTLREHERPTAAAVLPPNPKWDPKLGGVIAVAHTHTRDAAPAVTLFDAATGRRLVQLWGPSLPVDALAFSPDRPLLAAVGGDRLVFAWSLKDLGRPFPAVEGVTMVEQGNDLAVASVEPASPARGILAPGDVVEAVGGGKADPKPVKTYREYLVAVRGLSVGGEARLRVRGKGVLTVRVGRGVPGRYPLFDLWVDPVAKDGRHDWIGWSPAGPYDANSPAAEARLGWLTATGDPAEPARYAGADQYRRLYHKKDFLLHLVRTADLDEAIKLAATPRTPPVLTVRAGGEEERDGLRLLRAKTAELTVRMYDPEEAFQPDRAVLRWRVVGRDGRPGPWQELPFATTRATLPLADHAWTRGPHRFELAVHETPELPPGLVTAAAFQYAPPAPAVVVRVNGEVVSAGKEITSAKDTVDVSADVTAVAGEVPVVTLVTSGPGGEAAVELAAKEGRFGPVAVKLRPEAATTIRVTATNAGAGDSARYESASADAVVWHDPPKPKPAPRVRLRVSSPVDPPARPGGPAVVAAPRVQLSAVVSAVEGPIRVEWDDGSGAWVAEDLKPADPKAAAATRTVALAAGGKPTTLRVRATAAGVTSDPAAVEVVWPGLPAAELADLPESVRTPALTVRVNVRPEPHGGPFTLAVRVTPADLAEPLETVAVVRDGDGWRADVTLRPGDNRIGLVVGNEWKEVRLPLRAVRYVRPPAVAAGGPIVASGGAGELQLTVVSLVRLPPDRVTVDDRAVDFRPAGEPARVFGLAVWSLRAAATGLDAGGALPKQVRVRVRNADGESPPVDVAVVPKPAPPPPPPPAVTLAYGPDKLPVPPGGNVRTDEPRFTLGLTITSAARLTRVDVRRPDAPAGADRVPGLPPPAGVEFAAAAELPLREGINRFEVTAAAGESAAAVSFTVSYVPPPVRVLIDALEEAGPGGAFAPVPVPPGGPATAATGYVRVRGRVRWSAAEAARGGGYEVVLVANHVRHLPVALDRPTPEQPEVRFAAMLFLNAPDTTVRVEVRAPGRPGAVPQQQVADAALAVRCTTPLGRQRLHVLVIAPQVPEGGGPALAREVIAAVGGEYPTTPARFDRGTFRHKAFAQATLYRPLVYNVARPGIIGLLEDVDAEVRRVAGRPGPDGWVNDVVLVYYQGEDRLGQDGLRRLHTTRSLRYTGPAADTYAVRIDELPPTPGVRLALLNVTAPDRPGPAPDALAAVPPLLRYTWKDAAAADQLLPMYRQAVARAPTVGGVVDWVHGEVVRNDARAAPPSDALPPDVRARRIAAP